MNTQIPTTLNQLLNFGTEYSQDKIAFSCGEETITYHQLHTNSDAVMLYLQRHNVRKGDRVGILMSRTILSPVAVYGILKAGAVFVPLDPNNGPEKLSTIIDNCSLSAIITSENYSDLIKELEIKIPVLGSTFATPWNLVLQDTSGEKPELVEIKPSDDAYIIYTSGSTGTPKGIVHTHHSGLTYAVQSAELYELSPMDVVGNVAALHFDQSTFGYFSSILAGASTYLFTDAELIMLASFRSALEKRGISILYTVPSLFISLIESGHDLKLPKLRWIKYGGESFPPAKLNQLLSKAPYSKISNVYGPAEINQCTFKTITKQVPVDKPVPIGKVWENTRYRIINDDDVVDGEHRGQLLIHSPTMMSRYWNNPTLTQENIVLIEENGSSFRFYRTGDWVYLNEEGELVFADRKDRQVKIRGVRIELGEIENIAVQIEGIKEAAAFSTELAGSKNLVLALVLEDHEVLRDIRKKVRLTLPKYFQPLELVQLARLRRSGNGKIDYLYLKKHYLEDKKNSIANA